MRVRLKQLEDRIIQEIQKASLGNIESLLGKIDQYFELLLNKFNIWEISEIIIKAKEILEQMESFQEEFMYLKIINHMLKKLISTNSIYPGYFEYICDFISSNKDFPRNDLKEKEEILAFIRYYMFMKAINNVSTIDLLEELIQIADKFDNLNFKRIVLYCFKNTQKIKWDEKSSLFWDWRKNSILDFWEKGNPILIPAGSLIDSKDNIYSTEKEFYKYPERELLNILVWDSYLLLKGIPELQKEVKEKNKNTIFYRWEKEINELNEKIYLNLEDEKKVENLFKLIYLYKEVKYWNESSFKLISLSNYNNLQKNEELFTLWPILYSIPEVYQNIKEITIPEREPPDFILITKDRKKIGIEITGIDSSKDIKKELKVEPTEVFWWDLSNEKRKIKAKIENAIKEKKNKYNKYNENKYDENWLILHIRSMENILKISSFIHEEKNIEIKEEDKTIFHKIYFLKGNEIEEKISGQKYPISEKFLNLWKTLIEPSWLTFLNSRSN